MNVIRDWATAMCGIGIGCAVLSMLCPVGRMRRVFGVLTAVLFLCCVLSPAKAFVGLAAEWLSLSEERQVSSELSEEVHEQAEAVLTQTLFDDAVERVGQTATIKKVTLCRDNARTDCIYIERVRVTLDREDMATASTVRKILEQAWGVSVEVYYVQ